MYVRLGSRQSFEWDRTTPRREYIELVTLHSGQAGIPKNDSIHIMSRTNRHSVEFPTHPIYPVNPFRQIQEARIVKYLPPPLFFPSTRSPGQVAPASPRTTTHTRHQLPSPGSRFQPSGRAEQVWCCVDWDKAYTFTGDIELGPGQGLAGMSVAESVTASNLDVPGSWDIRSVPCYRGGGKRATRGNPRQAVVHQPQLTRARDYLVKRKAGY